MHYIDVQPTDPWRSTTATTSFSIAAHIASFDFLFAPHSCPQVLQTGSDAISGLVTIVSYDLAQRLAAPLNAAKFKVIVCDEAHFLKNDNAKRTQIIVPLVQAAKRALLLTGAL